MFHVYALENPQGRLYIGYTSDLDRRISEHNDPDGKAHLKKFTHKNDPWRLVGFEKFSSRSEAMKREKQLKSWKNPKRVRELLEKQLSGRVPTSSGLITLSYPADAGLPGQPPKNLTPVKFFPVFGVCFGRVFCGNVKPSRMRLKRWKTG